jgi:hypothetical protein
MDTAGLDRNGNIMNEIERLHRERDDAKADYVAIGKIADRLRTEVDRLSAENERLRDWHLDHVHYASCQGGGECDHPDWVTCLIEDAVAQAAEVERLTLTDTEFCDCEEGPYYGAQRFPGITRCERCRRPADSLRYAAEAEVERLRRVVTEADADPLVEVVARAVEKSMRQRTYDRHAYDEEVFMEGVDDIAAHAVRAAREYMAAALDGETDD